MEADRYPLGWDEERVRRVLEHYQSDEEALAEDEAILEATTHTLMEVPVELVPAVRELIARSQRSARSRRLSAGRRGGAHPPCILAVACPL